MREITGFQKPLMIIFILSLCVAAYSQSSTPEFFLVDQDGSVISTREGMSGSSLSSFTVSAGKGFQVKSVIAGLARGDVRVETVSSTTAVINVSKLRSVARPGDRIILNLKKVAKTVDEKEVEVIDTNKSITIPIS